MLPGAKKIILDPAKEKRMRDIPPLQLSSSDKIINIHDTKSFQDKHNRIPGVGKYGLANLSDVEETKTDGTIEIKDGIITGIDLGSKSEEIPAFRPYANFASDKDALEDL